MARLSKFARSHSLKFDLATSAALAETSGRVSPDPGLKAEKFLFGTVHVGRCVSLRCHLAA